MTLAALVAAMIGANLFLAVVARGTRSTLAAAEVLDPAEFQRIGQRLAMAEEAMAASRHSTDLVVVAGLSTAREDIDDLRLGAGLCGGARVLNLASSGGSFRELAFYLRSLEQTRLHSALTIVAVHPVWLAGRQHGRTEDGPSDSGRSLYATLRLSAERWVWLYATRRGVHAALHNALLDVRERIARRLGFDTRTRFPSTQPLEWAIPSSYSGVHAAPPFLEAQFRAWRSYGWFDSSRFSALGTEAASMRRVADAAGELGGPVVFVLLPEHSILRAHSPKAALDAFRVILSGIGGPPLVDLRDVLPDAELFDYAHANARGRAHLSALLAERMASLVRCGVRAS